MKTFFYLLFISLLTECKTNNVTKQPIYNLKQGLYFNGDLFLIIYDGIAISEYFSESSNYIGLREGFNDTLSKQNDTSYSGKMFSVNLRGQKLYFDAYFDPKEMYPIELFEASEKIKEKWNKLHNRLSLFGIQKQYESTRNEIGDPARREKLTEAYRVLQSKIDMDQASFLRELALFKETYLNK